MGLRPLAVLLAACATSTPAPDSATVAPGPRDEGPWTERERIELARMRRVTALPPDPTNRWADDPGAAALGRRLFYDKGLSTSGTFSCATCHDPALHFTDGLPKSQAAGTTARHAPTVEGSQLGPWFFWDGREDSLWAQAAGPIEHPDEMASDRLHVARYVVTRYADAYRELTGSVPDLSDPARFPTHARPDADDPTSPLARAWEGMTPDDRQVAEQVFVNALKAIAAFERTVLPGEAPFDRYVDAVMQGDESGGGHLGDAEVRGLRTFLREGNCVSCHHGPFFTDRAFHNLGLPTQRGDDPGRTVGAMKVQRSPYRCGGPWADTQDCEELRYLNPTFDDFRAAFKTPTLRNVTATAPYMHDGALADLQAVLAFYSDLPGEPVMGHRELTLRPLKLSPQARDDLIAFLGALEAPVAPEALPLD